MFKNSLIKYDSTEIVKTQYLPFFCIYYRNQRLTSWNISSSLTMTGLQQSVSSMTRYE